MCHWIFLWKCIGNLTTKTFCVLAEIDPCYAVEHSKEQMLHLLADLLNIIKTSSAVMETVEQVVGVSWQC